MSRVTYINDYVTYYWYYVTWRKICVLFVFLHLFFYIVLPSRSFFNAKNYVVSSKICLTYKLMYMKT